MWHTSFSELECWSTCQVLGQLEFVICSGRLAAGVVDGSRMDYEVLHVAS